MFLTVQNLEAQSLSIQVVITYCCVFWNVIPNVLFYMGKKYHES